MQLLRSSLDYIETKYTYHLYLQTIAKQLKQVSTLVNVLQIIHAVGKMTVFNTDDVMTSVSQMTIIIHVSAPWNSIGKT